MHGIQTCAGNIYFQSFLRFPVIRRLVNDHFTCHSRKGIAQLTEIHISLRLPIVEVGHREILIGLKLQDKTQACIIGQILYLGLHRQSAAIKGILMESAIYTITVIQMQTLDGFQNHCWHLQRQRLIVYVACLLEQAHFTSAPQLAH